MKLRQLLRGLIRCLLSPAVFILWLSRKYFRVQLVLPNVTLFGHLALEPAKFLAKKSVVHSDGPATRTLEIWSFGKRCDQSNKELTNLWKQRVHSAPAWLVDAAYRVSSRFSDSPVTIATLDKLHENDHVLDYGRPQLQLPRVILHEGQKFLSDVGLPNNYVCLIVRDVAGEKLNLGLTSSGPLRTRRIEDFIPAIEMLCKLGLAVIRVGSPNSTPLPQISSLFFDYANYARRTSRLDIFLPASCQFAISTMSGPDAVALAAGRPVLYLDLVQYHLCFAGTGKTTWVPAILKDATDCPLSLGEVFERGAGRLLGQQAFADKGITIELSSPLLIRDYVEDYAKEFLSPSDATVASIDRQNLYRKLFHGCLTEKSIAELAPLNSKLSRLFLARHGEWFLQSWKYSLPSVAEVDELQR